MYIDATTILQKQQQNVKSPCAAAAPPSHPFLTAALLTSIARFVLSCVLRHYLNAQTAAFALTRCCLCSWPHASLAAGSAVLLSPQHSIF
jgi:hypothetical protein